MITELGGICWVPTAVRTREKTIIMRKKEVTDIRKKGIKDMSAMESIN